jgi:hypothetical protein
VSSLTIAFRTKNFRDLISNMITTIFTFSATPASDSSSLAVFKGIIEAFTKKDKKFHITPKGVPKHKGQFTRSIKKNYLEILLGIALLSTSIFVLPVYYFGFLFWRGMQYLYIPFLSLFSFRFRFKKNQEKDHYR